MSDNHPVDGDGAVGGEGWHDVVNYKKYLHVEQLGTEKCEVPHMLDLEEWIAGEL